MSGEPSLSQKASESYVDIVWRQFKKHVPAYVSLWLLAPLALMAIFAPAIASDQPLVFFDNGVMIFPWLRKLFNPGRGIDFVFNMALLGFVPWLAVAMVTNGIAKRRRVPGRRRLALVVVEFVAMLILLLTVFSFDAIRPSDSYRQRTFIEEQFRSPETTWAIYTPIPFGPEEQDLDSIYKPPGYRKDASLRHDVNDGYVHVLGTDDTGRDVLVLMIYGIRIAITVGFVAVGFYITIGVIVGSLAGYFGGAVDMLLSRAIEVVLLFPAFFLILTVVALWGPNIYNVMVVIGITGWPTVARLIRGEVLKQRAIDYTVAARALGASNFRVIFRHILPNAISPALVSAPFGVASAIIIEAGLSLLGYGVRPPTPSWGALLNLGRANYNNWWLIVVPSVAIFLTVTIFNLVGSGLRDAMDPRLRK
jgi:peptide/nickel transport system permease protein